MQLTRTLSFAPLLAILACGDGPAVMTVQEGQHVVTFVEARPGLAARASIQADSALAIARLQIPNGEIVEAEIDEEGGLLLYEFEFKVAGEKGTRELVIDASTGAVLSVESEVDDDDGPDDDADDEDDHEREGHAS